MKKLFQEKMSLNAANIDEMGRATMTDLGENMAKLLKALHKD